MNHYDLLQDVDSENYRKSRTLETPYIALRAVLQLHKPADFESNDETISVCSHCQLGTVGDIYPCETIQAIQKELA